MDADRIWDIFAAAGASGSLTFVEFGDLMIVEVELCVTTGRFIAVAVVAILGSSGVLFVVDAIVRSPSALLITYAAAGLILPLLSIFADAAARWFPDHGAYHGLQHAVALRTQAVLILGLAGLAVMGWVPVIEWILAAALIGLAIAFAHYRWREPGHSLDLRGAAMRIVGLVRRRSRVPLDTAWRQRSFLASVGIFFIGQLLGSLSGGALAVVLDTLGYGGLTVFLLAIGRLTAAGASRDAGVLADRGLDRKVAWWSGVLIVAAAIPWAIGDLHRGALGLGIVLLAFLLVTVGLNALLTNGRAFVTRGRWHRARITEMGMLGSGAGWIGAALVPFLQPPVAYASSGEVGGISDWALLPATLLVLGAAAIVVARYLGDQPARPTH